MGFGKISKKVSYPEVLDMTPFCSDKRLQVWLCMSARFPVVRASDWGKALGVVLGFLDGVRTWPVAALGPSGLTKCVLSYSLRWACIAPTC